jgi:hypothetical protein
MPELNRSDHGRIVANRQAERNSSRELAESSASFPACIIDNRQELLGVEPADSRQFIYRRFRGLLERIGSMEGSAPSEPIEEPGCFTRIL